MRYGTPHCDHFQTYGSQNTVFFYGQNSGFRFYSKNPNFQRFFRRSFVKSRRKNKRPTVLSSLLLMLTIPITLRNIYFLTHFRIFCHHHFLEKFSKNKKISGLNTNGLEFKLRTQRSMAFHIVTIFSIMPAKTRTFL